MNPFEQWLWPKHEVDLKTADEAFELFKSLYNTHYGSIEEDENLIEIHTGGWSDNEKLIEQFRGTFWWFRYHMITKSGGHYYLDTDHLFGKKKWEITKTDNQ